MSRVSIVKCADYSPKNVQNAVRESVSLLGGIARFISKSDRVLVKPNLLSPRRPEEAVCTHPEFVRAALRLVKEAGATPFIGDSPGSFFRTSDIEHVYEVSGIKKMAQEENVELIRFERSRMIEGYPIAEAALNASFILSLPKMKSHALTVMTGAMKNTFGMIPGDYKVECHRRHPRPRDFAKTVIDVYRITKPGLSIIDGITAMDGDGPSAGKPCHVNLVLAGSDGVSLDRVVSEIVGLPPHHDILVNEARRSGAGEGDLGRVSITGERPEDVRPERFDLPATAHRVNILPDFVAKILQKVIRFKPVVKANLCKKCGACKTACPADAIHIDRLSAHINDAFCVRCFCCSEVCPYKAIYIKRNFITHLLWKQESACEK